MQLLFTVLYIPILSALFIPPSPSELKHISSGLKKITRDFFIKRAERRGIPWKPLVQKYKDANTFQICNAWKHAIENKNIYYPPYFLKPFHGYDKGNMNWDAAIENEAATMSISSDYWKDVDPYVSEQWLRNNITNIVHTYIINERHIVPDCIVDLGCSIGISTESIVNKFPTSRVIGIDLSPYFLSVASYRSSNSPYRIEYIHANAENIPLEDESVDLIAVQFMLHEVPETPTYRILNEIFRVLKPNGVVAIVDLDPYKLKDLFNGAIFRKWAFEITEPHINDYYKNDMGKTLMKSGFYNIKKYQNDPLNSVWCGIKIPNEKVYNVPKFENHSELPKKKLPKYVLT